MEEGFSQGSVLIILGRPFMKTARTKIDVYAGTLSMEFGDITVHFNILDAMKHPSEDLSVFRAEIIDHIVAAGLVEERMVCLGQQHSENKVVVVVVKDSTI